MTEALIKGLALGLFLTLSVGPVIFTIVKLSLNYGKQGGFSFVSGVWISDIVLVVVSNVFSEWVTQLLQYKQAIGMVGSSVLVIMGVYFAFFKKVVLRTESESKEFRFGAGHVARLALSGFLINTLNPSVIFFWLINATAFAVTHTLKQRIIIFSTCLLFNIAADIAKIFLAGRLRERLTLRNMSIINKLSGVILIAFGLALFYSSIFLRHKS